MGHDKERSRLVEQSQRYLESVGRPRLVMLGVLTVTLASGFLGSVGMVHLGVTRMPIRYPLAVGLAYATFFSVLWMWLRRQAIMSAAAEDPEGLLIPGAAAFGAAALTKADEKGERQGEESNGFSGTEDLTGLTSLEAVGAIAILAIIAGLCTLVVSAYLVVTSPALLAELLVDGVLLGALSRAVSANSPPHWSRSVVRRTWVAALVTAIVFGVVGWGIEWAAPGAHTLAEAWAVDKNR